MTDMDVKFTALLRKTRKSELFIRPYFYFEFPKVFWGEFFFIYIKKSYFLKSDNYLFI